MKILPMNSFIVLIGLMHLTQTTLSQCLEYLSPLSPFNRISEARVVDCPIVTINNKRQAQPTSDNMFTVDFTCLIDDKKLCKKVESVFIMAGKFITATLNLKSSISVNATFLDVCKSIKSINGCNNANVAVLGAAGPARFIPYQDPKDGKIRIYPQALYKQMDLPEHPEYGPNDISAVFNSQATYWFEGDPLPLVGAQADMLFVVLHELVHGLGFATAWNDYFNIRVLTPFPGPKFTRVPEGIAQSTFEGQFLEFIFDKFLVVLPSGKPVTAITDELNQFPNTLSSTLGEFLNSPQFSIAQDMYKQATTPNAIGFLITPDLQLNTQLTQDQIQNNFVILETSFNPFQNGSSIGHVDRTIYLDNSDFLMIPTYPRTVTLGDMMSRFDSTNTTGPIGPKLRRLLEIMGYKVKEGYIPPDTSQLPSSHLPSPSSSLETSPNISYNTLALICGIIGSFIGVSLLTAGGFLFYKYKNKPKQRISESGTVIGN